MSLPFFASTEACICAYPTETAQLCTSRISHAPWPRPRRAGSTARCMPYAHRAYRVAAAKPTTLTFFSRSRSPSRVVVSASSSPTAVRGRYVSRDDVLRGVPGSESSARASPASTSRNHSTSSASWHAVSLSQNASSGWPPAPSASSSSTSSGKHAPWIRRTSSTCARTPAPSSTRTSSIAHQPRG